MAAANPIGGRYDESMTFEQNVDMTQPILQVATAHSHYTLHTAHCVSGACLPVYHAISCAPPHSTYYAILHAAHCPCPIPPCVCPLHATQCFCSRSPALVHCARPCLCPQRPPLSLSTTPAPASVHCVRPCPCPLHRAHCAALSTARCACPCPYPAPTPPPVHHTVPFLQR